MGPPPFPAPAAAGGQAGTATATAAAGTEYSPECGNEPPPGPAAAAASAAASASASASASAAMCTPGVPPTTSSPVDSNSGISGAAGGIGSVVDDRLKVHGVQGLRIADASVFPCIPTAPTAAACMAVGAAAAEFVLFDCRTAGGATKAQE